MKRNIFNQQPGMIRTNLQTSATTPGMPRNKRKEKYFILAICILGLLISSCLVKSLHPFYKESDIVFRKDILGTYIDQDKGIWTIRQKEEDKEIRSPFQKAKKLTEKSNNKAMFYELKLVENDHKTVTLEGCLFKLNNELFVDFSPVSGNENNEETVLFQIHILPVHTVAKIIISKNELHLKWYNADWLSDLFKQNKIRLAHEELDNDDIVLTASTTELQKFMIKFANDPEAFRSNGQLEYILKRK